MLLALATYHTDIKMYGFNEGDVNEIGILKGHVAQVTALQNLSNTPMLISSDEAGVIKTWDVRTLTCYQTMVTESKSIY